VTGHPGCLRERILNFETMRIHTRLAVLSFAMTVLVLGAATLLWNHSLQRDRRAELNERLEEQAVLLAELVDSPAGSAAIPLDALVRLIHRVTGSRITAIALDGTVLADSEVPEDAVVEMENHLQRPEVQQALTEGRGRDTRTSATLGRPMAYVAVRWGPREDAYGVMRASLPLTRVVEEENRGRGRLVLVLLGGTVLAGLVGYVTARRISQPLVRVSKTALEIAEGNFNHRIEGAGSEEVGNLAFAVNTLTESLRGQVAAAESERRRLVQLLEGMPDGILALDSAGYITLVNSVAESMLGITRDEVVGRAPVEAVRHPDLQRAVDQAQSSGEAMATELMLTESPRRIIQVNVLPLEFGFVVLLRDVSRLRRLQEARREMVANIGHELRTPLSSVLGYVETLEQSPDLSAEERGRFLSVVHRNARRLQRLVEDLTRLSRLESPSVTSRPEAIALAEIASGVTETLAPKAKAKNIRIELRLPETLPDVEADRHLIETVFLNLLDNALRVSPGDSRVEVVAMQRGDRLEVSVADEGPGIPKEFRDRVFERFFRMDSGRTSERGGTGLGLAIVKHAILLHGGDVRIDDREGRGAVFVFDLPTASGNSAG
jgi:two-component system phosphate regulon sensor histidine kinase PhoR